MKNKKGFTLIELLTVIAILAVILLISIPIILGVLDRARKNSFKNQVLLYVEALKQQTGMALMGSGYSELKSVDNSFYAPTSDSDNKLVQVSVANLNKVMDNVALTNDTDKYFYVEYTTTGYNYYIGEGVRKEGEFSTTCSYASGNEACTTKTYNEEDINLINSKVFGLIHITRNDVATSGVNRVSYASGTTITDSMILGLLDTSEYEDVESVEYSGNVDSSTPGDYLITYTIHHTNGATSTATKTITIKASQAPVQQESISISSSNITSASITINYDELNNTPTCVYGLDNTYGTDCTNITRTSSTINGLTQGQTYYYMICTVDNNCITDSFTVGETSSEVQVVDKVPTNDVNGYYSSGSLSATYTISGITNAIRYVKTSIDGTSSVEGVSCGSGTDPSNCGESTTTSFTGETWYKVESNPTISYTVANQTIEPRVYAVIYDGNTYVASSNGSISIDKTKPSISVATSDLNATLTMSDNDSGIASYCTTSTNDSSGCTWIPNPTNPKEVTMSSAGTYYAFVRDGVGNISDSSSYTVTKPAPLVSGTNGQAVTLGGYKWHIIGQDDDNIYLLLDTFDGNGTSNSNRQIPKMNHCTNDDTDTCAYNGSYYVYSWENSLIRTYLNQDTEGGFLYTLPANVKAKLVETDVCKDSSLYSSDTWSYGGYTKGEITKLQETYPSITCNNGYTSDKVRLISISEYFNLTNYSSYASTTIYPVSAPGGNGKGYIPEVSYIQNRVSDSSWLYSSIIGTWWTMSAYSHSSAYDVVNARAVGSGGTLSFSYGEYSYGVRPVIVLQK